MENIKNKNIINQYLIKDKIIVLEEKLNNLLKLQGQNK